MEAKWGLCINRALLVDILYPIQASSSLVTGIKAEAETEDDSDSQKRLLAAAKVLADATAKLVEAAKVCSFQVKCSLVIFHFVRRSIQCKHFRDHLRQLQTSFYGWTNLRCCRACFDNYWKYRMIIWVKRFREWMHACTDYYCAKPSSLHLNVIAMGDWGYM